MRSGDRLAYALTGARVIVAPGRVIENGVVVVRGGVIEAAGPQGQTAIPADARIFDLKGKIVHAAFIDPYVPADRLAGKRPRGPSDDEEAGGGPWRRPDRRGGLHDTGRHPESCPSGRARRSTRSRIQDRVADTYRRLGFAVVAAAPASGILRGRGAVVSLGDGPIEARVLAGERGQYVSLEPDRFDFATFFRAVYPSSKMGAVAMTRQAFCSTRSGGATPRRPTRGIPPARRARAATPPRRLSSRPRRARSRSSSRRPTCCRSFGRGRSRRSSS